MKIVCDACSAKYSIADEKVAGKVFKIRCKKCSNIIVVRGTGGDEPAAAPAAGYDEKETRVFDYAGYDDAGGEAVWHLVIDQEQVGPMTASEVAQRFHAGEIDAEAYTWREGFADWQPLAEVEVFAALVSGGGGGAAAPAEDPSAGMFGGAQIEDSGTARSDPADLFAAAADSGMGDDGGADLFGDSNLGGRAAHGSASSSMADSLFGGGNGADQDEDEDEPQLRGQRNENSVLFSLNNLAALASPDRPAASSLSASSSSSSSSQSSSSGGAGMAQMGGGEGSGLIDIRSMATAYLADKGGSASPSVGSADDLPSFSSTSFDSPAAVLLPNAAMSSAGNNKVIYALFGTIAVLLVAAVVLVIVVLKGGDSKETPVAAGGPGVSDPSNPGDSNSPRPAAGTDADKDADKDKDKDKDSDKDSDTDADKDSDTDADKPKPSSSSSSNKPKPSTSKPSSSSSAKPKPPKPAPEPASSAKCDEVSCLLADNPPPCCKKYRGGSSNTTSTTSTKPKPSSDLPDKLSRADISNGMGKIRGRVSACSGSKGMVKVKVKVGGSGKVESVSVASSPDAGLGKCVASAVEKATFAKTQEGGSFTYPFVF
ncbi:MAG TPA: TonB family protein [Kofleriaceae bacterium]|nr:TonB family protein [Kofleriaceae bacterium]